MVGIVLLCKKKKNGFKKDAFRNFIPIVLLLSSAFHVCLLVVVDLYLLGLTISELCVVRTCECMCIGWSSQKNKKSENGDVL